MLSPFHHTSHVNTAAMGAQKMTRAMAFLMASIIPFSSALGLERCPCALTCKAKSFSALRGQASENLFWPGLLGVTHPYVPLAAFPCGDGEPPGRHAEERSGDAIAEKMIVGADETNCDGHDAHGVEGSKAGIAHPQNRHHRAGDRGVT